MQIPHWYVPSFYGDINLERLDDQSCQMNKINLTPQEKDALLALAKVAEKKKWLIDSESPLQIMELTPTRFQAPIDKVAKALAKALKPTRAIITAVKFSDGTMEEHRGSPSPAPSGTTATSEGDTPYRKPVKPKEPVAAASVAAPIRGCPPPDFPSAEIRAREVMRCFLDPAQLADFDRYNRFISVGATTGNRYMVTSRMNRDDLATFTRTLYDLDRKTPLCVHDWDVPPAEEMLTLHLLLQLPGWERYLGVTDENLEEALREHMGKSQSIYSEGITSFDAEDDKFFDDVVGWDPHLKHMNGG